MRLVTVSGLVILAATVACGGPQRASVRPVGGLVEVIQDERLGVDDVFEIRVLAEDGLAGQYRVGADGNIFFPFVGKLRVLGMTPSEAREIITQRLKEGYFRDPQVTLTVSQWNSRRILVMGQVNKPGPISYVLRMTIVDAIAAAGGFTPLASSNSVKLRREVNGQVKSETYRVADIGEGRQPNIVVLPGDILYVDERVF